MQLRNPIRIADHEVEITGRVVRLVVRGDFREEHARLYAELFDATIPPGELYVALCDVSKMKGLGPGARRYFGKWHNGHRCERLAIVGTALFFRGLISLVVRALSLTSSYSINLRFFSAEADAEAWITEWQKATLGKH